MITQFRLENFKGHRDTDLVLQQLTLLVGDNSSGTTSVLEALQLPGQLATHADDLVLEDLLHRGAKQMRLSFEGVTHGDPWTASFELTAPPNEVWHDTWTLETKGPDKQGQLGEAASLGRDDLPERALRRIMPLPGPIALYRFQSDRVAASAYSDRPETSVADDGSQTAVALAALKLADDAAFNRIEAAMQRLVPSLKRIFIKAASVRHPSNPNPVTGSKLYFDFQAAKGVPGPPPQPVHARRPRPAHRAPRS